MNRKRNRENLSWRIRFRIEKKFNILAKRMLLIEKKQIKGSTYSEVMQDRFVIKMTQEKKQGIYVEIGSGHPTRSNNTYLLESEYHWSGISVELNSELVREFKHARLNPVIAADATSLAYPELFTEFNLPNVIDYLQIDIDPALQSLEVLKIIPLEKYKFSVITFEHDRYRANRRIAQESRQLLKNYGYILLIKNVKSQKLKPFEDWWIHPELIEKNVWMQFQSHRKNPFSFNWN